MQHSGSPHELPPALAVTRLKQALTAGVFAVAAISASIYLRSAAPLVLLLGALVFGYRSLTIASRFLSGQIREVRVVCTSAYALRLRRAATVVFRAESAEENDAAESYRFNNLTLKDVGSFVPGASYLIYFDVGDKNTLLGYTLI